jgi:hypothetical protein
VVREDDIRKDLLFAGTESGVYVSWNGGRDWSDFQLNLPVTPITDIKIHQGNLIAATSGRSIWILDDLSVVRQYQSDIKNIHLYKPAPAILLNGSSELDESLPSFNGTHPTRGVNPATGGVIYYYLPEDSSKYDVLMEIRDGKNKIIRTFSSKADSTFLKYEGGPPAEPVLSKNKGLNRFVWNLRHSTTPGIENAYIESSYKGHKISPGQYSVSITFGTKSIVETLIILPNPLYHTTSKTYEEYDNLMSEMEAQVKKMHTLVNTLHNKRKQMEQVLTELSHDEKFKAIISKGKILIKSMKVWDEEMIQRKSKAYDDVENFPNKFTANYMFLINQTESDIPQINQSSLDRKKELDAEWSVLESRGDEFLNVSIPAFNSLLWEFGVGAVWKN